MLTVKECLETVKVQQYEIYLEHEWVGNITRKIVEGQTRLVFSEQKLLDYLSKDVCEIVPIPYEDNDLLSICNLVIDTGLPFDF